MTVGHGDAIWRYGHFSLAAKLDLHSLATAASPAVTTDPAPVHLRLRAYSRPYHVKMKRRRRKATLSGISTSDAENQGLARLLRRDSSKVTTPPSTKRRPSRLSVSFSRKQSRCSLRLFIFAVAHRQPDSVLWSTWNTSLGLSSLELCPRCTSLALPETCCIRRIVMASML